MYNMGHRKCCQCCKYCNNCQGFDFQKILHLKDTGIVTYKYKLSSDNKPVLDDIFIIQNTRDTDVSQELFLPEFEKRKVDCPRCKHLMNQTEKILASVKTIRKNEIKSVCEHCEKLKPKFPCEKCEKAANRFVSTVGKLLEAPKPDLQSWIDEHHLLQHLFGEGPGEPCAFRSEMFPSDILQYSDLTLLPGSIESETNYETTKRQLDTLKKENHELFVKLQQQYPDLFIFTKKGPEDFNTLRRQLEFIKNEHPDVFEKSEQKHPQLFASMTESDRIKRQLYKLKEENLSLFAELQKKHPDLFSGKTPENIHNLRRQLEIIKAKHPNEFEKAQQRFPHLFVSQSDFDKTKWQLDKLKEDNPELFEQMQSQFPDLFSVRGPEDFHKLKKQLEFIKTNHPKEFAKVDQRDEYSDIDKTKRQLDKLKENNPEIFEQMQRQFPDLFSVRGREDIHKLKKQLEFIKTKHPKEFAKVQQKDEYSDIDRTKRQLDKLKEDNPEVFANMQRQFPDIFTGRPENINGLQKQLDLIRNKYPKEFEKMQQKYPQTFTEIPKERERDKTVDEKYSISQLYPPEHDNVKRQLDQFKDENPELFSKLQREFPHLKSGPGEYQNLQSKLDFIKTKYPKEFEKIQQKPTEPKRYKSEGDVLKIKPSRVVSAELTPLEKERARGTEREKPWSASGIDRSVPHQTKSFEKRKTGGTEREAWGTEKESEKTRGVEKERARDVKQEKGGVTVKELTKVAEKEKAKYVDKEKGAVAEKSRGVDREKDTRTEKERTKDEKGKGGLPEKTRGVDTEKEKIKESKAKPERGGVTEKEPTKGAEKDRAKTVEREKGGVSEKARVADKEKEAGAEKKDAKKEKGAGDDKGKGGEAVKDTDRGVTKGKGGEAEKDRGKGAEKAKGGEAEKDRGRVAEKEKGGEAEKDRGKVAEKGKGGVAEKDKGRGAGKEKGGAEKDKDRGAEKETGGGTEKDKRRGTEKEKGGEIEKDRGRAAEKEKGGGAEKDRGRGAEKEKGGGAEKGGGRGAEKEKGGEAEKDRGKVAEKGKGGVAEKDKGRGAEKAKGGGAEKGGGRGAETEKGGEAEKDRGKVAEKGNGGVAEKDKGRGAGKEKGGEAEKDKDRGAEKGGGAEKDRGRGAEKEKGEGAEKDKSRGADKEKGGGAEKDKGRGAEKEKAKGTVEPKKDDISDKDKRRTGKGDEELDMKGKGTSGSKKDTDKTGGAEKEKSKVDRKAGKGENDALMQEILKSKQQKEKEQTSNMRLGKKARLQKEEEEERKEAEQKKEKPKKAKTIKDKSENTEKRDKKIKADKEWASMGFDLDKPGRTMKTEPTHEQLRVKRDLNALNNDIKQKHVPLVDETRSIAKFVDLAKDKLDIENIKQVTRDTLQKHREKKELEFENRIQETKKNMVELNLPIYDYSNVKQLQLVPGLYYAESTIKINPKDVKLRRASIDDAQFLSSVKTNEPTGRRPSYSFLQAAKTDSSKGSQKYESRRHKIYDEEIIVANKIVKGKAWIDPHRTTQDALLYHNNLSIGSVIDIPEHEEDSESKQIAEANKTGKAKPMEIADGSGGMSYALSDRSYIDKGWTLLPEEKVVRKVNIYKMRPSHPEFNWFEHNKKKGILFYETGEKLAEFEEPDRGCWYYRNGNVALDYYDAEEVNAGKRFVVYSNGENDELGRTRPVTVLASFDYVGNGIVFDHAGKIRLKYNQHEGIVMDTSVGPASHWKWNDLNDPPVLQQVMIDTQLKFKDPKIAKLGMINEERMNEREDDDDMLAIEFENFLKDQNKKISKKQYKSFPINMKVLKLNENFSLRIIDQANMYLTFRDGSGRIKINLGMVLDQTEIIDTDTADLGEITNAMERMPANTDSVAWLQKTVTRAQNIAKCTYERNERINPSTPTAGVDKLRACLSKPLRRPLITLTPNSSTIWKKPCHTNLYYNTYSTHIY